MNSREIAYIALLSSLREESFIQETLNRWIAEERPNGKDAALAREIAYGAAKRALTLDYLAEALHQGKLQLKRKERALLRTALYQRFFMDRVPEYALVNESVELAKKYTSAHFAKFLNALLRKKQEVALPQEESLYYSYPPYFVERLIAEQGREKAKEIFEIGNLSPVVMARNRSDQTMVKVEAIEEYAHSPNYYIQNETPWRLIQFLGQGITPRRILDLCASPGGKLIALHDLYPSAALFANDVSEGKIARLRENLDKYGIDAALSCGLGEDYQTEQKFDLVVLDVPCSNSGVLRKRPEARWRLSAAEIGALREQQKKLLEHALTLSTGEVWYMTCSILEEENEGLIEEYSLNIREMRTFLPTRNGLDGGYGCAIKI